jgi:hypothetical protein
MCTHDRTIHCQLCLEAPKRIVPQSCHRMGALKLEYRYQQGSRLKTFKNDSNEQFVCVLFKFQKLMDLLKLWNETFQNPVRDKYASKSKPAAFVTVTALRRMDYSRDRISKGPWPRSRGPYRQVGSKITEWKIGQRVGVGWHGGQDGHCEHCRRGDFVHCQFAQVPGISYDGGYADYMIVPTEALVSIPDELSATEAAPMMCSGITTYNAL